jgi:N-acetylmuramoyl-L-alanine amidase
MKNSMKIILVVFALVSLSFINFEKKQINVVIDAGHGGSDFGATLSEIKEKEIVAAISKKIELLNQNQNVTIHFTRLEDYNLTLKERVNQINKLQPDLMISIHVNSTKNTTVHGYEVYVSDKTETYEKSNELAEKFTDLFSKNTKLRFRGIKKGPFFVLKNSDCPSLLLDLGFLSNTIDKDYITSENGQNEMAQNIVDFIATLK